MLAGIGYEVQQFFTTNLREDAQLFDEYHALIVQVGKDYCKKTRPRCPECPLYPFLP